MNLLGPLAWTGIAFVTATVVFFVLRAILLAGVRRWAPTSEALNAGASAFRGPSRWWCVVVGLYVANEVAEGLSLLPARWHRQLGAGINIAIVLSITVTLAGLAGSLTARVADRRLLGGAVTGLTQTSSRVAVFVVGLLVVLSTLGIQIAPVLAALGVGGLAVAWPSRTRS